MPGLHRLGPRGASTVFGPQKDASAAMVARFDAHLRHYAALILRDIGATLKLGQALGRHGEDDSRGA